MRYDVYRVYMLIRESGGYIGIAVGEGFFPPDPSAGTGEMGDYYGQCGI